MGGSLDGDSSTSGPTSRRASMEIQSILDCASGGNRRASGNYSGPLKLFRRKSRYSLRIYGGMAFKEHKNTFKTNPRVVERKENKKTRLIILSSIENSCQESEKLWNISFRGWILYQVGCHTMGRRRAGNLITRVLYWVLSFPHTILPSTEAVVAGEMAAALVSATLAVPLATTSGIIQRMNIKWAS